MGVTSNVLCYRKNEFASVYDRKYLHVIRNYFQIISNRRKIKLYKQHFIQLQDLGHSL